MDDTIAVMSDVLYASTRRSYRQRVTTMFSTLVAFLERNDLVVEGARLKTDDDIVIRERDLNALGVRLMDTVAPKWFDWVDAGNDPMDDSVLREGLLALMGGATR